jgi:hypothetical protein
VTGGFEKAQQGGRITPSATNPPYKTGILTAPSADDDFTDLDHRAQIGIVRNVAHDLLGMRAEPGLEGLDRVAEDVTHSDIGRGRAGGSAGKALVHGVGLARVTHAGFQERHVLVPVVRVVEARARRIRIHHTYLDHGLLPHLMFAA